MRRSLKFLARKHCTPDFDVAQLHRIHGHWIFLEYGKISLLARLNRANLMIQMQLKSRIHSHGFQRVLNRNLFVITQHSP